MDCGCNNNNNQQDCPAVVPPVYPPISFPMPPSCNGTYVTKYYGLPLWRANDVTSWMVGLNSAMEKIDMLFHNFALRTGIDGQPTDLTLAVTSLETNMKQLLNWQGNQLKDMAQTTKVVADILGSIDLINEKIRLLNFNYSNLDVRVKSLEQQFCTTGAEYAKLLSTVYSLNDKCDKMQEQINEFVKGDNSTVEPEKPETGEGSEDNDNESDDKSDNSSNNTTESVNTDTTK